MNDDPAPSPAGDPRPAPPRSYRVVQRIEAPLANLVGLSCREFARLTVTQMDRPLTSSERIRHRLHARMCRLCARFAGQFSALEGLTKELEAERTADRGPASDPEAIARITAAVRASLTKP